MVNTPINIEQLQRELHAHTNLDYVQYLVSGFIHGFDTKVQSTDISTKECKNLQSAIKNERDVSELIQSELNKGFLSGPYYKLPFESYRVSPIGLAQGKYSLKKRLIVDLSAPHKEGEHLSINSLINKEECSLTYVRVDDAIQQLVKCGPKALMCKADIADAFKLIPIKPSQYHLFCVKWQEFYYFYSRLSFGCRSSPIIFDEFSTALCWIATHNYGIEFILHLLDDFLTIDKPGVNAHVTMDSLRRLFSRLNVPLSEHKTMGPSTVMEYLGIILDSELMQARLPAEKVVRITDLLGSFIARKTCTKRELLQLLGHLNFASRVIIPGRSFVSYLLSLASSVKEYHHHVHLSTSCREDMNMWLLFLQQWNGTCFFHETELISNTDLKLYTDASSTIGYGGYFQDHWFYDTWPVGLQLPGDQELSMAFLELYPIVVAAMLWGHLWTSKRILFYCDNMSTVYIIKKGRSKVQSIMQLMRHLTWMSAKQNFCIYAEHLPGVSNVLADCLSRLQVQRFLELAPSADKQPHKCPNPAAVLWDYNQALQN